MTSRNRTAAKKLDVTDRSTGKTVVRYQLTLDSGVNPLTGKRQQVRRRYATEKQAPDALSEIGQQAATARYAAERLALGAAHADSGYVAVNEIGEPYTPDTLTRMWRKLTTSAGVRPIRLHDARHSCGKALHLRGVPLAVIAKWLGHADASITARIYAHSQDDALRDAGKSLGAVVTSS